MNRPKARHNRTHARRRAKQRYNLRLNRYHIRHIVDMIQTGDVILSKGLTNTRTEFTLLYGNLFLRLIYCKSTKTIVTLLPIMYSPVPLQSY